MAMTEKERLAALSVDARTVTPEQRAKGEQAVREIKAKAK